MSAAKKKSSNAVYIKTLVISKAFTTSVYADIQTLFVYLPKLRGSKYEKCPHFVNMHPCFCHRVFPGFHFNSASIQ